MPFDAKLYRVLVAGPSDTQLDRETAAQIIYRWNHDQTWNHDNAKGKRIVLLPALWETDTRPQQGEHPQILIDRQMVAECDAMVAIFRTRLGSPTKTHISGTVEELEAIRDEGKEVMVYFYAGDVPQSVTRNEKFSALLDFKKELSGKGLHSDFQTVDDFSKKFTSHLNKLVNSFANHSSFDVSPEDATSDENDNIDMTLSEEPIEQKAWWSIMRAAVALTPEVMAQVDEAFEKEQSEEQEKYARVANEATYYSVLTMHGNLEALPKLENITVSSCSDSQALSTIYAALSRAYGHLGSKLLALEAAEHALEHAVTESQKAISTGLVGWHRFLWNDREGAYQLLIKNAHKIVGRKEVALVYESLAELYDDDNRAFLRLLALELAIENMPESSSLQFSAAVASDDLNMPLMTLRHYQSLLSAMPTHSAALNNLGVALEQLSLPILSIESYQQANKLGESLSAANLAHRYINAGFIEDAVYLLTRARALGGGSRTTSAETRIDSERESEEKRVADFAKISSTLRTFILQSAHAMFDGELAEISGQWRSSEGELVTIVSDHYSIQGTWSRGNRTYELQGISQGTGIVVESIKWRSESAATLYSSGSVVENTIGFFDAKRSTISILTEKGEDPVYWNLARELVPSRPEPD